MSERLVVVGGDAAGMTVASGVRRASPGTEIVVLEKGSRTSYAACGIPFLVAGEVRDLDSLVARTPEEFREQGIDVRTCTEATEIDLDRRVVEARDHRTGSTERVAFDRLMFATGARPTSVDWPGVDLPHVSVAHTLPDAGRLDELAGRLPGPVVVVGGGYIGIEMAEAFLARGGTVTIVDVAPRLLANLDPSMSERVAEAARRHGIELLLGTHVEAITPTAVVTSEGELPAAIVVLAIGVTPNTELAAAAGLATGVRDAVRVDDHQRASVDGVFSAGDCAESIHRVTGRPTWVALGTVANKTARVAAVNLAGGDAAHGGVLGTAITRLVDTEIARTGLTCGEAVDAGFEPVVTEIESWTRAPYLAEAAPIVVQLVHDRATRRLLGGQVVGGAGAGKRIDTVATALWGGFEVDELVDLDLAYAPPFAPVWDPVNTAARRAARPR